MFCTVCDAKMLGGWVRYIQDGWPACLRLIYTFIFIDYISSILFDTILFGYYSASGRAAYLYMLSKHASVPWDPGYYWHFISIEWRLMLCCRIALKPRRCIIILDLIATRNPIHVGLPQCYNNGTAVIFMDTLLIRPIQFLPNYRIYFTCMVSQN